MRLELHNLVQARWIGRPEQAKEPGTMRIYNFTNEDLYYSQTDNNPALNYGFGNAIKNTKIIYPLRYYQMTKLQNGEIANINNKIFIKPCDCSQRNLAIFSKKNLGLHYPYNGWGYTIEKYKIGKILKNSDIIYI
jgi:hypothetical protein